MSPLGTLIRVSTTGVPSRRLTHAWVTYRMMPSVLGSDMKSESSRVIGNEQSSIRRHLCPPRHSSHSQSDWSGKKLTKNLHPSSQPALQHADTVTIALRWRNVGRCRRTCTHHCATHTLVFRRQRALSSRLSSHQRRSLAHQMCTNLLEAVRSFHVIVVTNDAEVEQWAQQQHVDVVNPDAVGLNVAADAARAWARDHHREQIMIVHSDVPRPEALPLVCALRGIAIVPDHQRNGTNVFSLPVRAELSFVWRGSFQRHVTRVCGGPADTVQTSSCAITNWGSISTPRMIRSSSRRTRQKEFLS